MDWIKEHWITLLFALIGFIEVIVRVTPSEKDNSIFNFIVRVINALIPNRDKSTGNWYGHK